MLHWTWSFFHLPSRSRWPRRRRIICELTQPAWPVGLQVYSLGDDWKQPPRSIYHHILVAFMHWY
jgi:hypothetical protein